MNGNTITFISSDVKGIQTSQKIHLKSYVISNGIVFLQETHLSINDEKKWEDEFSGKLFFSHGKTDSCGVLTGYH